MTLLPLNLSSFLCILLILYSTSVQSQYSDANGKKYFNIGMSINGKTQQNCLNAKGYSNYEYQKSITNAAQLWGSITLSLCVSIPDQEIVVWVSGSSDMKNFFGNILFPGPAANIKKQRLIPWALGGGYTMGDSLLEGFTATWYYGFRTYLKQVWAEYCDFKIVFAGHSIGACVAQMLAYVTIRRGYWEKNLVSYYGYGSCRCGDQNFAAMFDQTVPTRFRINWNRDPVVDQATNSCPRTVLPALNVNPGCWFHACPAVKYSSGGTPGATCTIDDDTACTGGGNTNGDHTSYFGYTNADQYSTGKLSC